jgi:hypothetical protein
MLGDEISDWFLKNRKWTREFWKTNNIRISKEVIKEALNILCGGYFNVKEQRSKECTPPLASLGHQDSKE